MSEINPVLGVILAFIFGTCIGSFLNVLIWRLPREESIGGRSHCPKCGHELNWLDLFPLVSILFFRAKCRYCKTSISLRYPLIEVITGALFGLAWLAFTPNDFISALMLLKVFIVIGVCITVFMIDLEHYLILDKIIFPAAALMIIFSIIFHSYGNLLAGVIGFVPFWLMWHFSKGKWMGFGDAKYMAFMGFALGLSSMIVGLFISFTLGAVVGLMLIAFGQKKLSSKLPFGTFLAFSTIIALFVGQNLWDLYWRLL